MSRMQHENKPVLSSERKYSIIFVLPCSINTNTYLWHSMLVKKPEKRKMILIIWCTLMIVYYIYRMILYFPNSPMNYSKNNLIYLLFRHA